MVPLAKEFWFCNAFAALVDLKRILGPLEGIGGKKVWGHHLNVSKKTGDIREASQGTPWRGNSIPCEFFRFRAGWLTLEPWAEQIHPLRGLRQKDLQGQNTPNTAKLCAIFIVPRMCMSTYANLLNVLPCFAIQGFETELYRISLEYVASLLLIALPGVDKSSSEEMG